MLLTVAASGTSNRRTKAPEARPKPHSQDPHYFLVDDEDEDLDDFIVEDDEDEDDDNEYYGNLLKRPN